MCLFPIRLKRKINGVYQFQDVPCGKCKLCLQTKKDELSLKMQLEALSARYVFFGTLTLNNYYYDFFYDSDVFTKYKLKLLFANLRYKFPDIRYFITSELGSKTKRLHFHFIIYLYDDYNLEELRKEIKDKWKYADRIQISPANIGAFQYVTKYVLKQSKPIRLMSSRPPLGINYLFNNEQFFINSFITQKIYVNGRTYNFPKSYNDFIIRNRIQLRELGLSESTAELIEGFISSDERINFNSLKHYSATRNYFDSPQSLQRFPIFKSSNKKFINFRKMAQISQFNALDNYLINNDKL